MANTHLNENYSSVIIKKLPEKLGDPGKLLIPCCFSELKCKALADLVPLLGNNHGSSCETTGPGEDNLLFLLLFLRFRDGGPTCSSNRAERFPITRLHLLRDFVDELALITFPSGNDDLPFDIESDLKEIEYLLNHDLIKEIESILEDSVNEDNLANLNDNLADTMPEMLTDEHALNYSSPLLYDEYNDDLFEVKSDTEYVYDDPFDSKGEKIKDNLDDLNDNLVKSMPEMFTDEHALDYSSPSLFDEYDDDLFKVKSDTENVYDDPFDSKGEKIKESKLFIDELDLPCDFLLPSEYDSFLSEDFSKVDALPSTNNEDKVFNPVSVECQKPGHLAARLGCAETKVATWDDLAFKLITLRWNVKQKKFANR
nr:reverse transcriptase domain-containing protein [Tanacetum cinerariifolium]